RKMALKDASAYNVQFDGSKPIFIDTLSFEPLQEGKPWVAYGQFCRHFLAPLALMSRRDVRLGKLLESFIDGIPLELAVRMLPWRSLLNMGLFLRLRLQARAVNQQARSDRDATSSQARSAQLSVHKLEQLAEHLSQTVQKLNWRPQGTECVD